MEAVEAEYDGHAPNAEHKNREAYEEEGIKESEIMVCFNPDRVVEHDIGIELQSTCSVQGVEIEDLTWVLMFYWIY